jgi:uncharacterized protein (DUF302 family)
MMVFAEIDHTAAAIESGLTLPDTCVLIYGNPKVGTPIMQATPNTALDLPLHVLIRAVSKTETIFAYRPIGPLLQIDGAEADAAARLASAQVTLFKRFLSLQDQ